MIYKRCVRQSSTLPFELWAYYHLGLPVFTQDFWGIPQIEKKNKADSTGQKAEGTSEGAKQKTKDRIQTHGASGTSGASAARRKKKVDREAAFLKYSDSLLGGKGFVEWKAFDHPQLGMVEIGGVVPYADIVPRENQIDSLLRVQVPWVFELVKEIPKLNIETSKVKTVGKGIYQLEVWVRNDGGLPYPTSMGKRNNTPKRAVLKLDGEDIEFLSGKQRTVLFALDANTNKKIKWLLRAPKSKKIRLSIEAVNAYGDESTIKLGGE